MQGASTGLAASLGSPVWQQDKSNEKRTLGRLWKSHLRPMPAESLLALGQKAPQVLSATPALG